jgi:hypothetical protein
MKVMVVRFDGVAENVGVSNIRKDARLPVGEEIYFAGSPYYVSAAGYEGLEPIPVIHLERTFRYE